ncbi:SIS domain-containing protein [Nonomuraea polychroma]|uniref:SIS domain-containing protein n=1 Tax=Nonomuraea polychroma TaxID=46176 RepID=UPI003D915E3A
MSRYDREEMIRQVHALAGDARTLHDPVLMQVRRTADTDWTDVARVYVTGNGDSFHAALATELAFHTLAGVDCQAVTAMKLLRYGSLWADDTVPYGNTLVVGVSASGGNKLVIDALSRARERGARTLAVTSTLDSQLAGAAEHGLLLPLTGLRPCPGIRTYQASLIGLLLAAIELGRVRGHQPERGGDPAAELLTAADAVHATAEAVRPHCRQVADWVAAAPVTMLLGSGSGYGTAVFAAAKLIEGAGVFAAAQDLEEWEHVEVLARPTTMPTIVVAAPGRSRDRAAAVAALARRYGRRVAVVGHAGDGDLVTHADVVLPLSGQVREEFSPLLTGVFAGCLAYEVACRLGVVPFATNQP